MPFYPFLGKGSSTAGNHDFLVGREPLISGNHITAKLSGNNTFVDIPKGVHRKLGKLAWLTSLFRSYEPKGLCVCVCDKAISLCVAWEAGIGAASKLRK